ncbi:hypothetical protein [Bradyrhizobium sp. UNPA324]|uniref:hypothetical protein n=1 Tax=Bradyrhizobium sp. UNPA324 TaxID=1141174 RepID=UPI0015EF78D7|nr:hypothetical protein [Bradyrhizobium sp. UNPA324]
MKLKPKLTPVSARERNLIACYSMINLIIRYNRDDSIAKLKNMFGENMGGLNGSCSPLSRYGFALPTDSCAPTGEKLEAACRGRVLGASGGCGFSSLSFGRAVVRLSLFRRLSTSSHFLRHVMLRTRQIYTCAVLSERLQALVAELREVEKLRSKLRHVEARTMGRRRRTRADGRARAV